MRWGLIAALLLWWPLTPDGVEWKRCSHPLLIRGHHRNGHIPLTRRLLCLLALPSPRDYRCRTWSLL